MNKKYNILKYTLISLFVIACLSIPAMATADNPENAMILSGGIIINGADAPVGTIIEAKDGNLPRGSTEVQADGEYGNTAFNIFPVTKPENGELADIYVQLPGMSSSVKVASVIWGISQTLNIDADIDTSDGSSGNRNSGGSIRTGGVPSTGDSDTSSTETADTNTNAKEGTKTGESTATQSLKDEIEDTVFQTREGTTDNAILSSILIIGFIAIALLGYIRYKKM